MPVTISIPTIAITHMTNAGCCCLFSQFGCPGRGFLLAGTEL